MTAKAIVNGTALNTLKRGEKPVEKFHQIIPFKKPRAPHRS
jgi:hypothetical protein